MEFPGSIRTNPMHCSTTSLRSPVARHASTPTRGARRRRDLGQPLRAARSATLRPSRSTRHDARARRRRTDHRNRGKLITLARGVTMIRLTPLRELTLTARRVPTDRRFSAPRAAVESGPYLYVVADDELQIGRFPGKRRRAGRTIAPSPGCYPVRVRREKRTSRISRRWSNCRLSTIAPRQRFWRWGRVPHRIASTGALISLN